MTKQEMPLYCLVRWPKGDLHSVMSATKVVEPDLSSYDGNID